MFDTPGTCATGGQPAAQFVGLGDSTIDTGWYKTDSTGSKKFDDAIAAALPNGGNFTEAGGLMSPDMLAAYFGIQGALPANAGGFNFATGGARSDLANVPGAGLFQGAVPLTTQIANYLASNGGTANPTCAVGRQNRGSICRGGSGGSRGWVTRTARRGVK